MHRGRAEGRDGQVGELALDDTAVALDDHADGGERVLRGAAQRFGIRGVELEPAGEHRDRAPRLAGGRGLRGTAGRRAQRGVLREDLLLQLLQRRAGLDAELVDELAAALLEDIERLGLTPGSIQGEHQLRPAALAVRLDPNERLELGDHLGVPPELQLDLHPLLERLRAQLLEPRDLGLGEGVVGQLGERCPAPERECLVERCAGLRGLACVESVVRPRAQLDEPVEIELARLDAELVPPRPREERLGREELPEVRDVPLEGRRRRGRRLLAPERLDQAVGRDRLVSAAGAAPARARAASHAAASAPVLRSRPRAAPGSGTPTTRPPPLIRPDN